MPSSPTPHACPLVCHCLEVSEERVLEVLATCEVRTVNDIRRHTGAGDGCTACHRRLKDFLENPNYALSPPSCSER
jgi:bacterioferritin-associated ferredoxin